MIAKELRKVFHGFSAYWMRVQRHRQVVPNHYVSVEGPCLCYEILKMVIQFRSTACDVEIPDLRIQVKDFQATVNCGPVHHFRSLGTSIHVAMFARLVTELAKVYLKRIDAKRTQIQICFGYSVFKVHDYSFIGHMHRFLFLADSDFVLLHEDLIEPKEGIKVGHWELFEDARMES